MQVRSLLVGFVAGGLVASIAGVGGYLVIQSFETDLEVTPQELQLEALRAVVESHPIPQGADLKVAVEFGGPACGGVVRVGVDDLKRTYIVGQDSGDVVSVEETPLSVDAARRLMARADDRCF